MKLLASAGVAIVALTATADIGPQAKTAGADDYARLARKAYAFSRWHDPSPVGKQEGRRLKAMRRHAATPRVNRRMKAIHRHLRDRFKTHRAYRKVTPYRGFRGEGYWLRWLAVPAYIVECETRGYHGMSRFHASNGSARGAYQLIGWTSDWSPLGQHRGAYRALHTQGISAWACA